MRKDVSSEFKPFIKEMYFLCFHVKLSFKSIACGLNLMDKVNVKQVCHSVYLDIIKESTGAYNTLLVAVISVNVEQITYIAFL